MHSSNYMLQYQLHIARSQNVANVIVAEMYADHVARMLINLWSVLRVLLSNAHDKLNSVA
jgi:hypothetical protein